MSPDNIQSIDELVHQNKYVLVGLGIVVGAIVFALTQIKGKKTFNPFQGSALQQVGKGKKLNCPLIRKDKLSHDTYRFVFKLPKEDQTLGIDVGQHIAIVANIPTKDHIDGEVISRKYTPVSAVTQKGTFDLVIKVYRKNVHPRFPDGGVMSQWMETLKVGDSIDITGPTGRLVYKGMGTSIITNFGEKPKKVNFKRLFLVGGGTGITPLYQVLQAIAACTDDKTKVYMLYGNKTEDDILIKEELEAQKSAGNLNLSYTLDIPPENWTGYKGFITQDMLKQAFPEFDKSTLICTCGPGPMNSLVTKLFKEQGYSDEQMFQF
ncbi:Riboflavin synthase-like beta-barrel [Pseudocohnilembus persalinus]|uniref:NADH-cytochrome b5 reductase n=1 Tax=Pseudocohnilembus persalinus TaxID=266149 RepID=A0A0V0QGB1_PSEPJ|nr:Riboflavin synthase-like beta-barrel [Pseudocohnilembus persalinus]|eukprot:KRX01146.1 Riboflavin synthase-like beta-barrel [Pseudocohnilembus persalinus]